MEKTMVRDGKTYVWEYVGRDCDNCPFLDPCSGNGSFLPGYNASPDCGYDWVPVEEA